MGLIDDLSDSKNFPKPIRAWCSVCLLLQELDDKTSKALQSRLDDPKITHITISQVLKNNGHSISNSTIGRHRRGLCNGLK